MGSKRDQGARLRRIAEATAAEYTSDPRVQAVIIVGSVARGIVDEVSDIDLMLYLQEGFTKEEIDRENKRAIDSGGGIYGGTPEEGFGVWRCVDGVKVDLGFNMNPKIEELITEVLENQSLENDHHLILDGIQKSMTLYGEEPIAGWLERLNKFPEELAKKMVESHLRVSPFWVARDMCAKRDEQLWFPELMLEYVRRMLWVLCGLNRRYYPGKLKGFAHVVETLQVAPNNFGVRVESLFRDRLNLALKTLRELVLETYELVEEGMPNVSVTEAREWFEGKLVCQG